MRQKPVRQKKFDPVPDESGPPPARGEMGEFRDDARKQRRILAECRARTDWTPKRERWVRKDYARGEGLLR